MACTQRQADIRDPRREPHHQEGATVGFFLRYGPVISGG